MIFFLVTGFVFLNLYVYIFVRNSTYILLFLYFNIEFDFIINNWIHRKKMISRMEQHYCLEKKTLVHFINNTFIRILKSVFIAY